MEISHLSHAKSQASLIGKNQVVFPGAGNLSVERLQLLFLDYAVQYLEVMEVFLSYESDLP